MICFDGFNDPRSVWRLAKDRKKKSTILKSGKVISSAYGMARLSTNGERALSGIFLTISRENNGRE